MPGYIIDENLPVLPFWKGDDFIHASRFTFTSDTQIWQFAIEQEMTIITKDSDFYFRHLSSKHLPKVVWLRTGNMTKKELNAFMEKMWDEILQLLQQSSFVTIYEDKTEVSR